MHRSPNPSKKWPLLSPFNSLCKIQAMLKLMNMKQREEKGNTKKTPEAQVWAVAELNLIQFSELFFCPKFPSTDLSQAGKFVRCLYMHDFCTASELLNLKSEIQSPKAGNADNFGTVAGIQMLCTTGCMIASINS